MKLIYSVRPNEFDCFPTIKGFSEQEEVAIGKTFIEEVIQYLKGLSEAFNQYFSEEQTTFDLVSGKI